MKLGNIRHSLQTAGAVLGLSAVAFGMLAPAARASAPAPPPLQGLTSITLPTGLPFLNPLGGFQGVAPTVPQGFAPLPSLSLAPKWLYYFDYFRGWGLMRVDFVKFNWHDGARLILVSLYNLGYDSFGFPYWIESKGSGSELDSYYTFACDRQSDGLGTLCFQGHTNAWATYHPLGHPDAPRWFWIQPF